MVATKLKQSVTDDRVENCRRGVDAATSLISLVEHERTTRLTCLLVRQHDVILALAKR